MKDQQITTPDDEEDDIDRQHEAYEREVEKADRMMDEIRDREVAA
jgi:hypothetical protein